MNLKEMKIGQIIIATKKVTVREYNKAMKDNKLWRQIADATDAGPMWMHDSKYIKKIMPWLKEHGVKATEKQVIEFLNFAANIE